MISMDGVFGINLLPIAWKIAEVNLFPFSGLDKCGYEAEAQLQCCLDT